MKVTFYNLSKPLYKGSRIKTFDEWFRERVGSYIDETDLKISLIKHVHKYNLEHGRLYGFVVSDIVLGAVFSLPISGVLAVKKITEGLPFSLNNSELTYFYCSFPKIEFFINLYYGGIVLESADTYGEKAEVFSMLNFVKDDAEICQVQVKRGEMFVLEGLMSKLEFDFILNGGELYAFKNNDANFNFKRIVVENLRSILNNWDNYN